MDPGKFAVIFPDSAFVPVVLGFFGLGTGYLIYGPQELLRAPRRSADVDRAMGVWGIFMPGLCQLLAGVYLFVGLTWFQVFHDKALYMAALAFSAYGIHWFALGWNRFQRTGVRTDAGMCFAFVILSVLGMVVFFSAGAWPVGLLFTGLACVYVSKFFISLPFDKPRQDGSPGVLATAGEWGQGFFHTVTGLWLMYLTFATTLNITSGYSLPGG